MDSGADWYRSSAVIFGVYLASPVDASDTLALISAVRHGDRSASDRLFSRVYGELRQIADRRIASTPGPVTLSATGLVHEAYVKMVGGSDWTDRSHFMAVAARAMREILIDRARARNAAKRGGGARAITLDADLVGAEDDVFDQVLALGLRLLGQGAGEALHRLAAYDADLSQMVELRFFGGLDVEEAALVQGISARTAARRWARAKAHLRSFLV